MGARMSIPHVQETTDIYLPIVYLKRETKLFLPYVYAIVSNLANPGFEDGYTGWTFTSNQGMDLITQFQAHSGLHSASLGNGGHYRVASISQHIMIPVGPSTLSYWVYIDSADACGWDFLKFYVNSQPIFSYDICSSTSTSQWSLRNLDLSGFAGQAITLQLEFTSDATVVSYVYVDDFQFTSP